MYIHSKHSQVVCEDNSYHFVLLSSGPYPIAVHLSTICASAAKGWQWLPSTPFNGACSCTPKFSQEVQRLHEPLYSYHIHLFLQNHAEYFMAKFHRL